MSLDSRSLNFIVLTDLINYYHRHGQEVKLELIYIVIPENPYLYETQRTIYTHANGLYIILSEHQNLVCHTIIIYL